MNWIFPAYNYTERQFINFRIPDIFSGENKTAFEEFIHYYVPDVIVPYATKFPKLKDRKFRVCRFCKKGAPNVTFRKDAHVIPEFLGNRYLIHDVECDECNQNFSKYETSFASSIGLLRTADHMRGKQGIPKFKSKGLVAFSEKGSSGENVVYIQSTNPTSARINDEDKSITFQLAKAPYIPLHVMKILFKIGYSLLSNSELSEYEHLERILTSNELDKRLQDYCKVLIYTFPSYTGNPFVITYKKRPEFKNTNIPSKIVLLYFGRFMYEYILLNSTDEFMIKQGGQGRIFYIPPYWDEKNGIPERKIADFSGTETVIEDEKLVFSFDIDPNKKTP